MKKSNIFLLVLGMLVTWVVFAYDNYSYMDNPTAYNNTTTNQALQSQYDSPVKTIQTTIVKLNQLTNATTYSPQMMGFFVNQEITPLFDFDYIANKVLSTSRVNLNDEEIRYFANSLKRNVIDNLLSKLAQGRSSSLDFISARPMRGGNMIVVRLNTNGYSMYGMNIDLFFHKSKSGKWQIFDVALQQDSLIDYYQRMVLIKIRRYGVYGMLGRI